MFVGGMVEFREFVWQVFIWESFEEVGIILWEEDLELVYLLYKVNGEEYCIVFYFKVYCWEGELKVKEMYKFKEVEWFYLEDLFRNLILMVCYVFEAYCYGQLYFEYFKKQFLVCYYWRFQQLEKLVQVWYNYDFSMVVKVVFGFGVVICFGQFVGLACSDYVGGVYIMFFF